MKKIMFKTTKYICYHCKRHFATIPNFYGMEGKGEECPICGCTSFKTEPGRIIGNKSFWYNELLERYNELIKSNYPKEYLGNIIR